MQSQTWVIVPCYNEEKRLPTEEFKKFIDCTTDYFFLFVDDGSTDQTFKLLESFIQQNPERLKVLRLPQNGGKAEAVRQGFLEGIKQKASYLAFWDADLATPLEVLPYFMKVFQEQPQVEMILGARVKLMGHSIERNPLRHYLGRVFATFASGVLGLEVYDTQCGAKMFRVTETLKKIFDEPFCSRWIFDVEFLKRFMKVTKYTKCEAETHIYELPLRRWRDVAGSKVKPGDFFKAFGELIKIYLRYR